MKIAPIIFIQRVSNTQETRAVPTTETERLEVLKEIIAVCCESHAELIRYSVCVEYVELRKGKDADPYNSSRHHI